MRAIVQDRYGDADVLRLADVPAPRLRNGQVLVRVRAASLNAADVEILRGDSIARLGGLRRPAHRIPGSDVAGVIERVGPGVTGLSAGDAVFGDLFTTGFGAFAELVAAPAKALSIKPPELSFVDAATLPQAAVLAWQAVQAGRPVATGDRVCIVGAGGGAGTFAVQLAAAAGAEVTGVDRGAKEAAVRALGATRYVAFDAPGASTEPAADERYDRVVDVQVRRWPRAARRMLRPGGRYGVIGGPFPRIVAMAVAGQVVARTSGHHLGVVAWRANDPEIIGGLLAALRDGRARPVIDATVSLAEVPAAYRRLAAGEVIGKIVVTLD
ncbi:MAG: NAD(P)-dependent alcohol dehydrogenase [Chloroflexota bacterium]